VLREFADTLFTVRPDEESPYMLFVAPVREGVRKPLSSEDVERMQDPDLRVRVSVPRSSMPAITHVDYSARIQTLDPERHGRFYRLVRRFYELTGCPVVVNTSFNIRGEPIVCTPDQAFRCFMATDMDCLVLENFILMKQTQPAGLLQDAEAYKSQYSPD
jgi:carbamoyltransferase